MPREKWEKSGCWKAITRDLLNLRYMRPTKCSKAKHSNLPLWTGSLSVVALFSQSVIEWSLYVSLRPNNHVSENRAPPLKRNTQFLIHSYKTVFEHQRSFLRDTDANGLPTREEVQLATIGDFKRDIRNVGYFNRFFTDAANL